MSNTTPSRNSRTCKADRIAQLGMAFGVDYIRPFTTLDEWVKANPDIEQRRLGALANTLASDGAIQSYIDGKGAM